MKNILSRPLFMAKGGESFPDLSGDGKITKKDILMGRGVIPREMQMGGVAAMMPPPPMPMAPAPMVDPAAQVQLTEATATREGEALGQQYVDEMMVGIDTADSTEELIDAIRGNDKTLQQRYDELAGFVGEADASATPESVLTLVQPTIMMTEQGAMDSGIGELMQSIAGEVDMETEMGAPTPMGMGVGELMMTGSAEEIPQMNGGGVVQKFANGMEVTPPSNYANILQAVQNFSAPPTTDEFAASVDARLPIYQSLLADTDQTKRDLQSKFFFDVAQAGLNLASGVDPRTGQSMAGRPLASQLAAAAQPVAASAAQQAGQLRNVERAAALGALQSAEAAEASRIAAARDIQSNLLSGGLSLFGQERGQQFAKSERLGSEDFQREQTVSDQDFRERLADKQITLERDLFDLDTARRLEEIAKKGGIELDLVNERGEVESKLIGDRLTARLTEIENLTEDEKELITARGIAEAELITLRGLEQRATLRLDIAGRAGLQDDEQVHELEMQANALGQREAEFARELERLINNDEFTQKLSERAQTEVENAREAQVGGERGIIDFLTFGLFGRGETAFELRQKAQDFGFDYQAREQALTSQRQGFLDNLRAAGQKLSQELARNEQILQQQDLGIDAYRATTDRINAIRSLQTDYSNIFGSSESARMRGILTDQSLLDRFATGNTNPSETSMVIQSIEALSRPVTRFDPNTGFQERFTPSLPRNVIEAATTYETNFGPMFRASGGLVQKFQSGGEAMTEFQKRIQGQPDRQGLEPLPGLIVDEAVDFEQATGPVSGLKRTFNTGVDYVQDILGTSETGPLFPDVVAADEQLKAISNMTQRFIRESTTGRPFAVEIEALANELAQPATLKTDSGTLARLKTMRSQLKEIDGTISAILSSPEGFDQRKVIGAREDKLQIGPLLDNYDKLIAGYEKGMGLTDKPDPAMFERGRR